jgi:hypothetical protein
LIFLPIKHPSMCTLANMFAGWCRGSAVTVQLLGAATTSLSFAVAATIFVSFGTSSCFTSGLGFGVCVAGTS